MNAKKRTKVLPSLIYIKVVRTNFLRVLNFGEVGGPNKKIQEQPLGWIFLKSY